MILIHCDDPIYKSEEDLICTEPIEVYLYVRIAKVKSIVD